MECDRCIYKMRKECILEDECCFISLLSCELSDVPVEEEKEQENKACTDREK